MKPSILLRRAVIALISLCVAFILITVLVNLSVFDEDLRPEVVSILQPVQIPPHEDNAYIAIWGISAIADKDIVEAGVRLVERYHHNREQQGGGERKAYGRDAVDAMTTIWPGSLYNLGGKIFLAKMLGYQADYIARVHDLNSMIGLVKLQLPEK